jgi:hypothetical protein
VIIWDTGPPFAAADVDDRDHFRCVELMRRTPVPLLMPRRHDLTVNGTPGTGDHWPG